MMSAEMIFLRESLTGIYYTCERLGWTLDEIQHKNPAGALYWLGRAEAWLDIAERNLNHLRSL
jgi:hypothetical protein